MTEEVVTFHRHKKDTLRVLIKGDWSISFGLQNPENFLSHLTSEPETRHVVLDANQLGGWDSSLICYLVTLNALCKEQDIAVDVSGLPQGIIKLIALAEAVPEREGVAKRPMKQNPIDSVGVFVIEAFYQFTSFITFLGEALMAVGRLAKAKAVFRRQDLLIFLTDTGPSSLGIVTLISVLIGMILAFVGSVQLEKFGASIYVASLVGLAMAREMAPMMTAIIMAGRTGAAYAAQLGSMQVNEEIDALKTMGVSPVDYLVLPRLLALIVMMPLLTIYANMMGVFGGALVSILMLDLTWSMYLEQMMATVPLTHFFIGLVKSLIFGILVALSGCYMGMNSGRSASAVGQATTSAVVMGIVLIIVFDSLVTIVTTVFGI
ncbi:ABC transporter permease [Alkalimarinus sediminis]|uniref:ABC transporter permease n=1 Tax=Alkalimarinus sediminis TaxID=1632866 RepID=A0A9E8HHY0_9ALTE|nr:ABC transporter permease [Alkalimarinus sediminis]UZW74650.1 ABC transporter permease [Alkalimarinus sediminis]